MMMVDDFKICRGGWINYRTIIFKGTHFPIAINLICLEKIALFTYNKPALNIDLEGWKWNPENIFSENGVFDLCGDISSSLFFELKFC